MEFVTDRLHIRPFAKRDFAALCDLFGHPEVMAHLGNKHPMTKPQTQLWLRHMLVTQHKTPSRMAVALKDTEELIGVCGVQQVRDKLDFAYMIRRDFWGRGYASEACLEVFPALHQQYKERGIEVFIAYSNLASLRIADKIGLHLQGRVQNSKEHGFLFR